VIYFAALNLVIGLATEIPGSFVHIDNFAHLGGCACGFLFRRPAGSADRVAPGTFHCAPAHRGWVGGAGADAVLDFIFRSFEQGPDRPSSEAV